MMVYTDQAEFHEKRSETKEEDESNTNSQDHGTGAEEVGVVRGPAGNTFSQLSNPQFGVLHPHPMTAVAGIPLNAAHGLYSTLTHPQHQLLPQALNPAATTLQQALLNSVSLPLPIAVNVPLTPQAPMLGSPMLPVSLLLQPGAHGHVNSQAQQLLSSTLNSTSTAAINAQAAWQPTEVSTAEEISSVGAPRPVTHVRPSSRADQKDGRSSIPLYLEYDGGTLTAYQCLLRKQIELFEAGRDDVRGSTQGRNIPIRLGQVGIRCRHCAPLPKSARNRGAVYYSKTIDGVYQVAQNMSKLHFLKNCHMMPEETRQKLVQLKTVSTRASGGKEYWSQGLRVLGVYDDGTVLRFKSRSKDNETKDPPDQESE